MGLFSSSKTASNGSFWRNSDPTGKHLTDVSRKKTRQQRDKARAKAKVAQKEKNAYKGKHRKS